MSDKQTARVAEDIADSVEEMLGEEGHSKSELIRAAFELYEGDSTGRDFLNGYMADEFDSLGKYALDCLEASYELSLTDEDKSEVFFGFTDVISGVQNGYRPQAMRGVENLAIIDEGLAEDVAEYLDKLGGKGEYWED